MEFRENAWIWNSNILGKYFLPKPLTNSFNAIVAVDNVTLVVNKNAILPDPFEISYKYTYPMSTPFDMIDPLAIDASINDEEEYSNAKLQEKLKATIYKSGDWTDLPKLNITINVYTDGIDVNYDEIKDIANVKIVKNDQSSSGGNINNDNKGDNNDNKGENNGKKGLETKYIIVIVVCCVVVIAIVVVVVIFAIKHQKVSNASSSP